LGVKVSAIRHPATGGRIGIQISVGLDATAFQDSGGAGQTPDVGSHISVPVFEIGSQFIVPLS
jgi:hypothetical protein